MLNNKKLIYLVLGIIITVGFLLRIYNLSGQSIWYDEAFSIYHSQQPLKNVLDLNDTIPPLYNTLLHFWISLFNNSEFNTRLLSVLFGTFSIFIIYKLGNLIFNKNVGIYSALILSLSPLHVYYSQEARTYSLLFLLSLLSMYFYLKLKDGYSNKNMAGHLISSILLVYSHLYGLLILFMQAIHQFVINDFKFSKRLKNWFLLQILTLVFFLPWLLRLPKIISGNLLSWIPKPQITYLIGSIYLFFSGEVFSIFGVLLTLTFIFLTFKSGLKATDKRFSLFLLWIFIPIVTPFVYSLFFKPIFMPKYVYFVSLPLFMIAAYSLSNINKAKRSIFLIIIIILSLSTLFMQQNTTRKDPWREVADFIQTSNPESEAVVIVDSYEVLPFSYYFNPGCFDDVNIYNCSRNDRIYAVSSLQQIKEIEEDNMWLILSRTEYNGDSQAILDHLNANYDMVLVKEYLLNQNSKLFNRIYEYAEDNNLFNLKFNKIRIFYLQHSQDKSKTF